jgi:hypothetical protein
MKTFKDFFKETTVAGDIAMTMGDKPPKVQKRKIEDDIDDVEDEELEDKEIKELKELKENLNPAVNPFDSLFKKLKVGEEFKEVRNAV